jgi:cytochrome c oxidase subunit 1/cytochrome c oxidase subunit I+III
MADERLGKLGFWITFVGFNLAFLPMHLTGLRGMPRRIYTYPANMGWDLSNMVISIGAVVLALGVMLTIANFIISRRRGAPAGANPWDAATLEWAVASPPPPYNFRRIPIIASRHPLWEDRLGHVEARSVIDSDIVLDDGRETLATSILDAEADSILRMPNDSLAPLLLSAALLVLFLALLWSTWWLAMGAGLACIGVTAVWLAPTAEPAAPEEPAHG